MALIEPEVKYKRKQNMIDKLRFTWQHALHVSRSIQTLRIPVDLTASTAKGLREAIGEDTSPMSVSDAKQFVQSPETSSKALMKALTDARNMWVEEIILARKIKEREKNSSTLNETSTPTKIRGSTKIKGDDNWESLGRQVRSVIFQEEDYSANNISMTIDKSISSIANISLHADSTLSSSPRMHADFSGKQTQPATVHEAVVVVLDVIAALRVNAGPSSQDNVKLLILASHSKWHDEHANCTPQEAAAGRRVIGEAVCRLMKGILALDQVDMDPNEENKSQATSPPSTPSAQQKRLANILVVFKYLSFCMEQLPSIFTCAHQLHRNRMPNEILFDDYIPADIINSLVDLLRIEGEMAAAIRLIKLFPLKVDADCVRRLCYALMSTSDAGSKNLRELTDLMVCIEKEGLNDCTALRELAVDLLDALLCNNTASQIMGIPAASVSPFDKFTAPLSANHFHAAEAVYKAFHYFLPDDLKSEIEFMENVWKMESFINAGKWQIAALKCGANVHRKSTSASKRRLQLALFKFLYQRGMFLEAQEVYNSSALHEAHKWTDVPGAAFVKNVTAAELKHQHEENLRTYLQLPLDISKVTVVRDIATAELAEWDICSPVYDIEGADPTTAMQFVGVDSEWDFNSQNAGVSILQIATVDRVWIFDMNALGRKDAETSDYVCEIFCRIFHDPRIVKLGCAFNRSDLSMLRSSANGKFARAFQESSLKGMLEIGRVVKGVDVKLEYEISSVAFPPLKAGSSSQDVGSISDDDSGIAALTDAEAGDIETTADAAGADPNSSPSLETASLKRLCNLFLGKPLNKSCQLSDWNQYALSTAQLTYASLDAHCLLALLDIALRHYAACSSKISTSDEESISLPFPPTLNLLELYMRSNKVEIAIQPSATKKLPALAVHMRNFRSEVESYLSLGNVDNASSITAKLRMRHAKKPAAPAVSDTRNGGTNSGTTWYCLPKAGDGKDWSLSAKSCAYCGTQRHTNANCYKQQKLKNEKKWANV